MILDTLWSFAYHRTTDLAAVRAAVDGLIVVDSGAFTAFTTGRTITVEDYAAWLTGNAGAYDYAITLDVIGDPAATEANTAALLAAGLPVSPVLTVGQPLAIIDAWAEQGHRLIFAGGLVGLPRSTQTDYLRAVTSRAARHGIAVHALGVGGAATLRLSGAWSGDSSAPFMSRMRGQVMVYDPRLGGPRLKSASDRVHLAETKDWLIACGLDVGELYRGDAFRRPDAAEYLARSALAAYAVTGHVLRDRHPRDFPTLPTGPRLMAACGGNVAPMVTAIGSWLANDPPSIAVRATRTKVPA